MYEFKVILTKDTLEINSYLDNGWTIQSVTAQSCPNTSEGGNFLILLRK